MSWRCGSLRATGRPGSRRRWLRAGQSRSSARSRRSLRPGGLEFGEQALDGGVVAHVAFEHQLGVEFGGEFSDAVLEAVADVAESQFGAFAMAGLGDAVGDGAVRKQARDEQALAGEESHAVSGVLWSSAILT
jgi:hypothetical protein